MTERSVLARVAAPRDAAALAVFRMALGLLVTISAVRFLAYGWVSELFVKPTFYFKYFGFSWVRPLPEPGMHVLFAALAVLGLAFAAGFAYRVVAPLSFLGFAYVQLIDVTNWLNHYYLVSLLLFLCSFMPLGRAWSADALLRTGRLAGDGYLPAWCTYLLRFQVGAVYFYAGIAKLSSDWLLHAEPLNIWLSARSDLPVLGRIFDERWAAYAFSWAGFLFDTTIVLFLLLRRTRPIAYLVVVGFHAMTWLLFPIGMFPFIMVTGALVFFASDWPRAVVSRFTRVAPSAPLVRFAPARRTWVALAAVFCVIQALVPLRHRLYGGNVLWHEQGMRLSWKVMVREKNGAVTYVVTSPSSGRTWYVAPRKYLTDRQQRELSGQPDLILQLAHHVRDEFHARGVRDVVVKVDAVASLNGRPGVPMIDPAVDLARVEDGLGKASWILPEPTAPPIHLRPSWNRAALASRSGS